MSSSLAVSVIVPVYNTEKYLHKCIDSVLGQTLQNIEVICIDDGSTDDSLSILKDYSLNDKRIRIISQSNVGAGVARNLAIKEAKGDFLAFIDSDDWWPDAKSLEILYSAAIKWKVNIAGGSFSEYDSNTGQIITDYRDRGHLADYQFVNNGVVNYSDWQSDIGWIRFIYNRKMIVNNHIEFPDLTRHEDPVFLVNAMIVAKKFYAVKDVVYRYRIFYKKGELSQKNIDDAIEGISTNLATATVHNLETLRKWSVESLWWYLSISPLVTSLKNTIESNNKLLCAKDKKIQQIQNSLDAARQENCYLRNENSAIINSKAHKVVVLILKPFNVVRRAIKRAVK